MPTKAPDDSRIVSVRLPDDLLQRLDRYLDWSATHRCLQSTRNAAMREALSAWLDHQEQLAGRFCRKVRFLGQNPKIGYQKFNDLQTAKLSKKQLCDRTLAAPARPPDSMHVV